MPIHSETHIAGRRRRSKKGKRKIGSRVSKEKIPAIEKSTNTHLSSMYCRPFHQHLRTFNERDHLLIDKAGKENVGSLRGQVNHRVVIDIKIKGGLETNST